MSRMEAVESVTYGNGVTLHTKTAEGWPVDDVDGTRLVFPSIPAFMGWCAEHYSWPMPMGTPQPVEQPRPLLDVLAEHVAAVRAQREAVA